LLAFACIHEQAVRRRREDAETQRQPAFDEYFGLDEVLRLVAARAAAITGADGVAVALAKEDAIICRASFGKIAPDPGVRLDPHSGFSGACLRKGEIIRCDDSETDSRVDAQACHALGTRSMVAVPLTAKGRIIGLIEAFSSETYGFNESDVRSLELLGELILAAIHPAEEDRLAQLAEHILPQPPAAENPAVESKGNTKTDSQEPTALAVNEFASNAPAAATVEVLGIPAVDEIETDDLISEIRERKQREVEATAAPSIGAEISPAVATPGPPAPEFQPAIALHEIAEPEPAVIPMPVLSFPQERRSKSTFMFVAAMVLVALGLAWAWLHHAQQLSSANTGHSTPFQPAAPEAKEPAGPVQSTPKPGMAPEVTGVRHWSSPDSSTVVIDLQDQVQYETHTLDNPPRIYFDLFDTKMASGLVNQSIVVDDAFIKRVRMAQPSAGTTRVVLDTKGITEISVKLDPNPYRLTIDVHKPPAASAPVPLSKPSPSIATSTKKNPRAALSPASDFRVVLDAGHGGWDLGTVGRKGLLEKDLVLDIVQRLGKLVESKLRADVIYTRQDDSYLPLEKRAEIANLTGADLFLSVHANYSDLTTARGVETYYTTTYSSVKARTADADPALKNVNWTTVDIREKVTNSHRLAEDVQHALYSGLAARTPAIRDRGVKEAQYVVLTGTQMPAILAEVSFVSSPVDESNLQSAAYRQQIAEALYRGVARYRAQTRPRKLASRSTSIAKND
jgi:N-acetylmuramoyl-L-alanine amidase